MSFVTRELLAAVEKLDSLEDVIRWGFAHRPAFEIVEVIVQDEFTHDVVMSAPSVDDATAYLVFDTT